MHLGPVVVNAVDVGDALDRRRAPVPLARCAPPPSSATPAARLQRDECARLATELAARRSCTCRSCRRRRRCSTPQRSTQLGRPAFDLPVAAVPGVTGARRRRRRRRGHRLLRHRAASARRPRRRRSGCRRRALGRRAVVVTIDPAKRLADALGMPGGLSNDPVQLHARRTMPGELWALMLDTATTFDGLVRGQRRDARSRPSGSWPTRSTATSPGRSAARRSTWPPSGCTRCTATTRFDVVVVDTPPTRNALDFLDAPGTLTRFLDHPLFKLMMLPTRRGLKVLNVATQPVLRIDRQGGRRRGAGRRDRLLPGVRRDGDRASASGPTRCSALLHSDVTRYVLVASPRARHRRRGRATSPAGCSTPGSASPRSSSTARTPRFGDAAGEASTTGARRRRSYDNLAELQATSGRASTCSLAVLLDDHRRRRRRHRWVPLLPSDVHDLDGLRDHPRPAVRRH